MNVDRLFALYDRVADAPDAVGRLRRFVLDLGVRGKLVVQDPAEEPALELLHQARRSLEDRAGSASRARWKATAPLAPEEIHAEMPPGWVPARVNDTGLYVNGLAFKPADWKQSGTPIIRIQNLTDAGKGYNFAEGDFPDEVKVRSGDLLVSWSATLEAFRWERGEGVLDQHIFRVIPDDGLTTRDFLLLILKNAIRELSESDHAHGLVMTHINRGPFLNHVTLIPPLAEQHRIVAKVDELLALCDQLEAARTAREDTRDRLTKASLARLSAPGTDVPAFRSHARFAVDALPALTARADQVKNLRQTILSLAVRGRLVEQDPEDEPASELLQRTEKPPLPARYAKRSPESIPGDCGLSINRPEIPSPPGWLWVPLVQVARIESGHTPSRSRADWWGGDVPWMGLVDARLHNDGRIFNTIQHTNEAGLANSAARLLPEGTVCFSRTASVGYVVIMGRPMATSQDFVNWVPTEALAPEWLQLVMMAERPAIPRFSKGAVHQTIYYPAWLAMHVALPPLAEQHRIVAEIDALMALCDHMEAGLAAADATRSRLLESLLHAALASAASRTLSMDRPFSSRHPSVRGGLSRLAHSDRIDE